MRDHLILSDTEIKTVLLFISTLMWDHLERLVSKNQRNQMSWKTVFGPIGPVELADREDKDHDSKKKRIKQLFPVWFSTSAGVWSLQSFPSWSSFTQMRLQSQYLCYLLL